MRTDTLCANRINGYRTTDDVAAAPETALKKESTKAADRARVHKQLATAMKREAKALRALESARNNIEGLKAMLAVLSH